MKEGRLDLTLRLIPQGRDVHAILAGGAGHAGATALAAPGEAPLVRERPGHREGPLAGLVAGRLCAGLGCAVSVSCGIHFEAITRQELAAVEMLAGRLVEACLASLHTRSDNPC
ncbi:MULTISPECIES: hypothetical protein [unclassified Desulfovibrio]|uniref:prenylated flavin chaperone LpdD n=1 Tax=unclassified Desulfovibrio TaxID=2593640 RepID=UPI001F152F9A|nr:MULTISPECIES: hypothetical protein [unclassified Desulfovibrio]